MAIVVEVALPEPSLKILMVTSEVVPFAKAGGLGDMVAGLGGGRHTQGPQLRCRRSSSARATTCG